MKTIVGLILLIIPLASKAQDSIPPSKIVDGTGFYEGLKKVLKASPTSVGDFYVSSSDDFQGKPVKWFVNTKLGTNVMDRKDGLNATKALLKWAYRIDIDKDGLSASLSAYPQGLNGVANGAVEACFQKNYTDGHLIPGTTPANMWYLPAQTELLLVYQMAKKQEDIFVGIFSQQAYWSSTEANPIFAWSTYYPNEYTFTEKSLAFGVRCVRR